MVFRDPRALAVIGSALLLLPTASASCDCGYSVNRTAETQHAVFTDTINTDFQHSSNITWSSQPGYQWQVQEYNTSVAASRGPYGKAAQLQNVVLNNDDGGTAGGSRGVQLWVRSQLIPQGSDELVPIAEMVTARTDILYGSFRFNMLTTPVNGTCGAAFFYHNDSQEVDMEVLSRQQSSNNGAVQLVVQSPASVNAGFNAANTSSLMDYGLASAPWASFLEYRFDWLPDRVDFYTNGLYQWSVFDNIPNSPGQIHLSHWSNGNPEWSAGPPTQDAVLTVSSVVAYFNISSMERASSFRDACASSRDEICGDDGGHPEPTNPGTASSTSSAATMTPSSEAESRQDLRVVMTVQLLAVVYLGTCLGSLWLQ